jgi:hypothetical protein
MDPGAGDVVRERLEAFLAYSATQDQPSDDGWELFDQLCQAVNDLGEVYEPTPKHLADPPVDVPISEPRWDNWFVTIFDGWNQEDWSRQPGDKLTVWQKFTIAGQIVTTLLVIGMTAWLVVWIGMHNDEWQPGRTP